MEPADDKIAAIQRGSSTADTPHLHELAHKRYLIERISGLSATEQSLFWSL